MALMIPKHTYAFNESKGERLAFNSLQELDKEFVVFHSFNWHLRTDKYFKEGEGDFVVFDPRYGLLVIEVKSGGIRTNKGVWYQKNLSTKEEHILRRSPIVQADKTRWKIIKLLEENNINIQVRSAIWLTSVSKNNIKIDDPHISNEIIFWKDDLTQPSQVIRRAFEYYKVKEMDYNPDLRRSIINTLAPSFNAMPTGQDLIAFNESNFVRMTREQSRILDFLVEQQEAAIVGGAGTGKTLLAIEKAKRLSKTGKVLLLCFNLFLKEDLEKRVEDCSNVEVHNIYSLIKKYFSNVEDIYDNDKITNLLLDYECNKWPFKHIVIDEGQDIHSDHLLLLKSISDNDEDGFFYVFYDVNQTVHLREELSWRKEILCQLVLTVNCRNTKNIAETSHSVLEKNKYKVKSEIDGDKATFTRVENKEELIDKLDDLITKYIEDGYRREDIVILTHKTLERSILTGVNKIGRYTLDSTNRASKRVFFTTSRKFKGLESPILLLIDLDKNSFDTLENKRLFYVATSRAKLKLDLLFTGSEDDYEKFMKQNIDTETKFVKNWFAQKLNVDILS